MKNTYPQTYHYILESIESGNVHNLSSFNQSHREEILRLFLSEVSPLRLDELNEDFFPSIQLEVSFLYPENKSLRSRSVDILWDKYELEIDNIFDQADLDDFMSQGGISEYQEWSQDDLRQRCRDAA